MTRKTAKAAPVTRAVVSAPAPPEKPEKTTVLLSPATARAMRLYLAGGLTGATRSASAYIERLIKQDLSLE